MSKAYDYFQKAELANQYVKQTMPIGAANRFSNVAKFGVLFSLPIGCVAGSRFGRSPREGMGTLAGIRAMANRAALSKCGNCQEQAAVAFMWLHDHGVGPIDYMTRVHADHAFVVVGRSDHKWSTDTGTWGDDCVVCDPWDENVYYASEIEKKMYGGGKIAPYSEFRWTPLG